MLGHHGVVQLKEVVPPAADHFRMLCIIRDKLPFLSARGNSLYFSGMAVVAQDISHKKALFIFLMAAASCALEA